MVVRYGAINDSVGEVTLEDTYTSDDRTEGRQSDDSLSVWDRYRNFLTGKLKLLPSPAKVRTQLGCVGFKLNPHLTRPPDHPDSILWP